MLTWRSPSAMISRLLASPSARIGVRPVAQAGAHPSNTAGRPAGARSTRVRRRSSASMPRRSRAARARSACSASATRASRPCERIRASLAPPRLWRRTRPIRVCRRSPPVILVAKGPMESQRIDDAVAQGGVDHQGLLVGRHHRLAFGVEALVALVQGHKGLHHRNLELHAGVVRAPGVDHPRRLAERVTTTCWRWSTRKAALTARIPRHEGERHPDHRTRRSPSARPWRRLGLRRPPPAGRSTSGLPAAGRSARWPPWRR